MEGISVLTDDAILYLLQHLDIYDRITFAYACERFRQICMARRIFRKLDLGDHRILRRQQTAINEFFRDRQMAKHIRELNLNNHRVMTWQMNDHLEEFIMSICPHLEALHVLNCGMSFQTLRRILKRAPKLTSLSWSLLDLKPGQDIKFLVNGMCLKNIRHLHLEILALKQHIQILKHLVLCHCKYLEELEIYMWEPTETFWSVQHLDFEIQSENLAFLPQPSAPISDALPHLHSLTFADPPYSTSLHTKELSDFISSIVRKKSRETKWKKLWIAPQIDSNVLHDMLCLTASSVQLPTKHPHEFHSVEAVTACSVGPSVDTVDDFKTFFQKIGDNSVKNLHICLPNSQTNLIVETCKSILRIGGHALKFLSLFVDSASLIDAEANLFFKTFFSGCLNIKHLDLLLCHFEDNICEALLKLKHLDKIQLRECAIFAKHKENQVEITKGNLLTVVQNCQNITEFDICGCDHLEEFSTCSIDDDLMALAKLTKLKSLTLHEIYSIKEWTFLPNISEHCKCLTMLRISAVKYFNKSCIPIILESAKFLKHFAIVLPELDLGLEDPWKLLSCATNLERLCITTTGYMGSPNVSAAVEMLKSLPRLHLLHLHAGHAENIDFFCHEIAKTLKEEEADYSMCFELLGHTFESPSIAWLSPKALPLNAVELCHMRPILAIPRL